LQLAYSAAQDSSLETATRESLDNRLAALDIELLGLDFMEQQHALSGGLVEAEVEAEAEMAMVRIKSQEAATEISTLMIEILGYYALPDEDTRRLDNEGPLPGPQVGRYGQGAVDELLGYVAGFEAMIERDRIATLKL
jgi:hypothetical protein